jgi:hypothetical protein
MGKKDLLKEELKRHMQLLEYTFYMPEESDNNELDPVDDLLLGDKKLYEEDPIPGEDPAEDPAEDPFATPAGGEEVTTDTEVIPPEGEEGDTLDTPAGEEVDAEVDPFGGEEGMEVEDEFVEEPSGDETIEVDVTDIVDKAEETRTEIEGLTAKMEELMGNFSELTDQVSGMDQVIDKIEGLEKEIEKRNPTPVERLEMRSMDSFPYSVKLTDYWADKEGYDVDGKEEEDYTLTKKDVDDYSETEIKNSFDYDDNDENY